MVFSMSLSVSKLTFYSIQLEFALAKGRSH